MVKLLPLTIHYLFATSAGAVVALSKEHRSVLKSFLFICLNSAFVESACVETGPRKDGRLSPLIGATTQGHNQIQTVKRIRRQDGNPFDDGSGGGADPSGDTGSDTDPLGGDTGSNNDPNPFGDPFGSGDGSSFDNTDNSTPTNIGETIGLSVGVLVGVILFVWGCALVVFLVRQQYRKPWYRSVASHYQNDGDVRSAQPLLSTPLPQPMSLPDPSHHTGFETQQHTPMREHSQLHPQLYNSNINNQYP